MSKALNIINVANTINPGMKLAMASAVTGGMLVGLEASKGAREFLHEIFKIPEDKQVLFDCAVTATGGVLIGLAVGMAKSNKMTEFILRPPTDGMTSWIISGSQGFKKTVKQAWKITMLPVVDGVVMSGGDVVK